jgi:hypothetical protein
MSRKMRTYGSPSQNSKAYFSAAIKIQIPWWTSLIKECLKQGKMHVPRNV